MALTRLDRERISDNRLKLQAVTQSLKEMDPEKIPDFEEIQECLKEADRNLGGALRASHKEP